VPGYYNKRIEQASAARDASSILSDLQRASGVSPEDPFEVEALNGLPAGCTAARWNHSGEASMLVGKDSGRISQRMRGSPGGIPIREDTRDFVQSRIVNASPDRQALLIQIMNRMHCLFNAWPAVCATAREARPAFITVIGVLLGGCSSLPTATPLVTDANPAVLQAVMECKNRIVYLSSPATQGSRPVLLLLHGATEDPTEMMEIVREWNGKYDVYLYSFNYHQRVEKLAFDLVREMQQLKAGGQMTGDLTVVTYSYSAILFRTAVIQEESGQAFSGARLIQLVPTAGGSRLALGMGIPIIGSLASLASKPSAAQNPFGSVSQTIWDGNGNRKFHQVIPPERTYTLLVEGDLHSLADHKNADVRRRYRNGLGSNVATIPKSAGVTHEYLPIDPVALDYLRQILEPPPAEAGVVAGPEVGRKLPPESKPVGAGKSPDVAAHQPAGGNAKAKTAR
jgi:hypothetical protein